MKRVIFKNAPLVEMIVELKWRLVPVQTMPHGGVDPFHDMLKQSLAEAFKKNDYKLVEETVPSEIPRELLAGQVTTQFKKKSNTWPLFQLGPGVFTVNITEDYSGWSSQFREIVLTGVETLYQAHPAPKMLELESIRLMAIDAFSNKHSFRSYLEYSREFLNLGMVLPDPVIEQHALENDSFEVRSETSFQLKNLENSLARISISNGKKGNDKALILQTVIETGERLQGSDEIMKWLDSAHQVHKSIFQSLLTEKLRSELKAEEVDYE